MYQEGNRNKILSCLQWNDRNGCYTNENYDLEGVCRLNYDDTIKFFFRVMNEYLYYSKVDNIFELSYDQTIAYAKWNGFYDNAMEKLQLLLQEP